MPRWIGRKFGIFILYLWFYADTKQITMNNIKTLIIDILNEEAIEVLEKLECQDLIRIRKKKTKPNTSNNSVTTYKGAMQKEPIDEVEKQLKELRESW